ncbi:unnamed protein product, partial [Protopolystoma xenopodis]
MCIHRPTRLHSTLSKYCMHLTHVNRVSSSIGPDSDELISVEHRWAGSFMVLTRWWSTTFENWAAPASRQGDREIPTQATNIAFGLVA